jgi:hypothetical protein
VELAASGERRDPWQDRGRVPEAWNTAADYLRTRGSDGGIAVMRRDSIVEEVRRHREAIAIDHGTDLDAIVAARQREDVASCTGTVLFPPKRFGQQYSEAQ